MAQVPKIYAPTPAQVTANARAIAGTRVASLDGQIGDSSSSVATSNLDTAPFTLQGETHRGQERQNRNERPPVRGSGLLLVPSRAFGSLVEYYGNSISNDAGPELRSRRNAGLISRAISTYETNAKIIHGEQEITGTEISIRL
jgi:hypothetical protein